MIGDAVDPDLAVPAGLPALDRPLGALDFPLHRTFTLDDERVHALLGRDARVETTLTGGSRARLRGVWALTGLDVAGAARETGTATPVGAERRLRLDGVSLIERVVVPRTGPLCFLEWRVDRTVVLPLSWLIATGPGTRWRVADRVLAVEAPPGRLLYVLSEPGAWSVERRGPERTGDGPGDGALAVGVRVRIPAGESVRLAVAAVGPGDQESRLLRMMGRAGLAVPARRAEALRVREQGLGVRTGDPALDEALEWEKARAAGMTGARAGRVRGSVEGGSGAVSSAVSEALLALVAGEHRRGREALSALGAAADRSGEPRVQDGASSPDGAAAYLFVAARYLAWTGDRGTVLREWGRIGRAAGACLERVARDPDPGDPGDPGAAAGCGVLALRGMIVAAEEVGDGEMASRLKAAVGAPEAGESVACWPAAEEEGVLVAVVHGLLGIEPDASKGRVALRPRPAPEGGRLEVRNLVVGGAAVDLDYRGEGGVHRFALRQSRGGAPLQVVLEPELPGARVRSARVDGEAADLDPAPADGRLRVPVQLVLDRERQLEVEMEAVAT